MPPLSIVEQLDIAEDCLPGVAPCSEHASAGQFVLHRVEETLRHSVVMAFAFATHARDHAERREILAIFLRRILAALV